MVQFDLEGARKAGYSNAEIADHLAGQSEFDIAGARKSGYSDDEIISHLATPPRSAVGEIATQAVASGRVELPKMIGQAMKYMSEPGEPVYEAGKSVQAFGEDAATGYEPSPNLHNPVTNALAAGARMLAPSIGVGAATAFALSPLGLATGGEFAVPALITGAVFGASQAQQTLESGEKAALSHEDAVATARKTGLIEAGGEALGTYFGYKLFGLGARALFGEKTVQSAITSAVKEGAWKPFLKQIPGTVAVEAGTEYGQNWGEAMVEQNAGIPQDQTPHEAGVQGFVAALGMTALLAPFGLAGFVTIARQNAKVAKALQDPETDPVQRAAASTLLYERIKDVDPEAAKSWEANTAFAISNKLPIVLDESSAQPNAFGQSPAVDPATDAAVAKITDPAADVDQAIQEAAKATGLINSAVPSAVEQAVAGSPTAADLTLQKEQQDAEAVRGDTQQAGQGGEAGQQEIRPGTVPGGGDLQQPALGPTDIGGAPGGGTEAGAAAQQGVERDVGSMTGKELDLAARLTRSDERRAALNAEIERRATSAPATGPGASVAQSGAQATPAASPLTVQPIEQTSAEPVMGSGGRWMADRGAMPGEPILYLDAPKNGELSGASAAIVEREVPGKGVLYDAKGKDGALLGVGRTVDEAKAIAEKAQPAGSSERAPTAVPTGHAPEPGALKGFLPVKDVVEKRTVGTGDFKVGEVYDWTHPNRQFKEYDHSVIIAGERVGDKVPAYSFIGEKGLLGLPPNSAMPELIPIEQLSVRKSEVAKEQTIVGKPIAEVPLAVLKQAAKGGPKAEVAKAELDRRAELPAVRQQLYVEHGGRRYPVDSLEDASRKWEAVRDRAGAGVSEIGNGVIVTDQDGKEVARISYNGRVWPPGEYKPGNKPLYEPYREGVLSHPENRFETPPVIESTAKPAAKDTILSKEPPGGFTEADRVPRKAESAKAADAAKVSEDDFNALIAEVQAEKSAEEQPETTAPPVPEGAAPATEAAPAGAPKEFEKGDRVEFVAGAHIGRQGEIAEKQAMRWVTIGLYSRDKTEGERQVYYQVKTDNGGTLHANPEDIKAETAKPEKVVADIQVNGQWTDPAHAFSMISHYRRQANGARAASARAKRPDMKEKHLRTAAQHEETADKYRQAFNDWSVKFPAEAAAIETPEAKAVTAPSKPASTEGTAEIPAMTVVESKNRKTGGRIWVVNMNKREEYSVFKAMETRAQQFGGYYARGRGAVRGYTFDTESKARQFMGQEAAPAAAKAETPEAGKQIELGAAPAKTASQIAGEAAGHLNTGINEGFAGLDALFGRKGTLGMGPAFDENTWAAAKPHFDAAFKEFVATGKSLKEFVRHIIDSYNEAIIPYLQRWHQDLTEAQNAIPDRAETQDHGDRGDAGERAQDVRAPEESGDAGQIRAGEGISGDPAVQRADEPGVAGRHETGGVSPERGVFADSPGVEPEGKTNRGKRAGPSSGIPSGSAGENYYAPVGGLKRQGSWLDTARRNIEVIKLVKALESEARLATPEEQSLIAQYTGFGASEIANGLFPVKYEWSNGRKRATSEIDEDALKPGWKELYRDLQGTLEPKEMETLTRSTQYAHYTAEPIIRSIWNAVDAMGFRGGKILEPGMGTGLFMVAAPQEIAQASKYVGIEMDHMTASIAKQLLQQHSIIQDSFIDHNFPDNFFDLAIGNLPFAGWEVLADPRYRKFKFKLHDYFFAKTIDRVRPGGLLVFVTSAGTMNKLDDKARQFISDRANLLGAIRLPQTAFKQSAGTEVVTDIIFLQKRTPGEAAKGEAWAKVDNLTVKDENGEDQEVHVNEYFTKHPEMVLGTHSAAGSMYRSASYTVLPLEGNIEDHFAAAAAKLPTEIYAKAAPAKSMAKIREESDRKDMDTTGKKEGGLYAAVEDGEIMQVRSGVGVPLSSVMNLTPDEKSFLKSYVPLRDALKKAQMDQLQDGPWEQSQKELVKSYRAFVRKHGRIQEHSITERKTEDADGELHVHRYKRFKWNKLLKSTVDVEMTLALGLERINEENNVVEDGDILSKRVLNKPGVPEIHTVQDALSVTLNELGKFDLGAIAEKIGRPQEQVIAELGELIYEDPTAGWQMGDEYLSGEVVRKLEEAQAAAQTDSRFARNVEALAKVQPEPLGPASIDVRLGANWVPDTDVRKFVKEVMDKDIKLSYDIRTNIWDVPGDNLRRERGLGEKWGTADRSTAEILSNILNNRDLTVRKTDADKKSYVDKDSTAKVNDIATKMREAFNSWIWTDAERAGRLLNDYNRRFNNLAPRSYDGSFLTLPGLSMRWKPFAHQLRTIWRILQTGNTYVAHAVGAGKTMVSIISAMEQRRLGLIKRPMFVVPNHMLEQFANEFMDFYPAAKILIADKENFIGEERRRFVAKASLGDWDAIIIKQSSFGLIGTKKETRADIADDFLNELQSALDDVDDSDRTTRKRLEAQIESFKQRVEKAGGGDTNITFEDMGVDFLYVDEAHGYRKLDYSTNNQIKGIDPVGSLRAFDMFVKVRYLDRLRPGRNLVMMSGTPITNTVAELYTVQRYMNYKALVDQGLHHFDAWANTFGAAQMEWERDAAGRFQAVTRFSSFVNVPEMMMAVRNFMDVLTMDELGTLVNRPVMITGRPQMMTAKKSQALKEYMEGELARRLEASKKWKPSPEQPGNPDPVINIITDGRLAAIDMRFVNPRMRNDPESKLNLMIDTMISDYKASHDVEYFGEKDKAPDKIKGSTHIVFSAIGFGDAVAKNRGFDVKGWIIQRLKDGGVRSPEVAFMSDFNTDAKKEAMFAEMREGRKRFLIGSPANMGTGLNVQKRLRTEHFLAPPWYPADVEQPLGRILRQGNQNPEVDVRWYVTEGTYDSSQWGMVRRKGAMIEKAFKGDKSIRKIEDLSEVGMYAMAEAIASGDDRVIKLAEMKANIERYTRLQSAHFQEQADLQRLKRQTQFTLKNSREKLEEAEKAVEALGEDYTSWEKLPIEINGKTYEKPGEAGAALIGRIKAILTKDADYADKRKEFTVGELGGQKIIVSYIPGSGKTKPVANLAVKIGPMDAPVLWAIDEDKIDAESDVGIAQQLRHALDRPEKAQREARTSIEEGERSLKQTQSKIGAPFEYANALAQSVADAANLENDLTAADKKAAEELKGAMPSAEEKAAAEEQQKLDEVRYISKGTGIEAVKDFTDITLDELPDVPMFLAHIDDEWVVTDTATGRRIKGAETKQEAIAGANRVVKNIGADVAKQKIAETTAITPEQKREALGLPAAPEFSREDTDQTKTPEFKRWFKDSKVVKQGKPLIVYRGDGEEFNTFDFDLAVDGAHFFTDNESHAGHFGNVREFYLSLQNPLEIMQDDLEAAWDRDHPNQEIDAGHELPRDYVERFVMQAKAAGHDGLIIRNFADLDTQQDIYLAFSPEQIKSATGNRGTFSPANADIRFSRAGAPDAVIAKRLPNGEHVFGNQSVLIARPLRYNVNKESVVYHVYDPALLRAERAAGRPDDAAHVGLLEVDVTPEGRITGLGGLFIDDERQTNRLKNQGQDRQGYGEKTIRAILASLPDGAELKVYGILPEARGFWEKMGARIEPGRFTEDGFITRQSYEAQRTRIEDGSADSSLVFSRGEGRDQAAAAVGRGTDRLGRNTQSNAAARQAVVDAFGEKATAALEREGLLHFVDSPYDFPAAIHSFLNGKEQAVYWNNQSWIVASDATPAEIVSRVLHEIGEHHGLKPMLGDARYEQLMKRINLMHKSGNAAVWDAWARVLKSDPHLQEGSEAFMGEVIARVGQDQRVHNQSWWRDLLDAIRAFIIKHYNIASGKLTEDHIQTLLRAAVRAVARAEGQPSFMPGEGVAASREPMPKGTVDIINRAKELIGEPELLRRAKALENDPRILNPDAVINGVPLAAVSMERAARETVNGYWMEPPKVVDQTQTPAFRKWFGDSKVVDAEGKPLVVYHGTTESFETFDPQRTVHFERDKGKSFFFGEPRPASEYALAMGESYADGGANVIPVYLQISKPHVVDVEGYPSDEWDMAGGRFEREAPAGTDGFVVRGKHDDGTVETMYVVMRPEQIKSAIGNRGTFDASSPDIRFSRADEIGQKARDTLADLFDSSRQFNRWWHTTVGTQQHKARINRAFKVVYDRAQEFLADTSRLANEAADLAPDMLPRIESVRDLWKKSPDKTNIAAASNALFAGTLYGDGSPLKGRIWSDDELSGRKPSPQSKQFNFNMTPAQIALYRQSLAAVNKSMDELAKALIARNINRLGLDIDRGMSLEDVAEKARTDINDMIDEYKAKREAWTDPTRLNDETADLADMGDEKGAEDVRKHAATEIRKLNEQIAEAEKTMAAVTDIENKAVGLKDHGYFPAMRFGRYAVYVTEDDGHGGVNQISFGLHETQMEANRAARDLAKEYPDATVTKGVMSKEGWRLYQGLSLDALQLFAEHMTDEQGGILADPLIQGFLRAATNERSMLKRHIHRKGVPGYSQDVPRSLAHFTLSSARAASSNYHMHEMTSAANEIKAGDVKDEAVKLVKYLQDPQEEAHWVRGFLFFNYLGGSVASAAVNMTQPVMVTAPYLSQFTSYASAVAHIARAAADAGPMAVSSGHQQKMYAKLGKRLGEDFKKAVTAGIVSPQEIHQLRAEAENSVVGGFAWRKFTHAWGALFSLAEQFNRGTTFIAAWRIADEQKMSNPYEFARRAVEETQFVYNKGSRPDWARGPVGSTVFTFKQFSISYIEVAKRLYDRDKLAFALLMGTLFAVAGLEGLPFAEDIEDIIDTIGQWLGYGTNSKRKLRHLVAEIIGKDAAKVVLHGVSGIPGVPLDVSQRMGMHNLIPGTSVLKPSETNKLRDVQEFIGPVGGVIANIGKATEFLTQGKVGAATRVMLPTALQNVLKALEMAQTGEYRDVRGRKVADVTPAEAVLKGLGFQPNTVAQSSMTLNEAYQDISLHQIKESGIVDKWARGVADRDPAAIAAARQEMQDWNRKNPELRIAIRASQIIARARELRRDRETRFIKSTPRELRQNIKQNIMEK